jgi:hypothetical protein
LIDGAHLLLRLLLPGAAKNFFVEFNPDDYEQNAIMASVRSLAEELLYSNRINEECDTVFCASLLEKPLTISGPIANFEKCANDWAIDARDAENIIEQLNRGVQLRKNHEDTVDSICGKTLRGWLQGDKIMLLAEIIDEDLARKVQRKYNLGWSLRGKATQGVFCSVCGKPTRPIKTCKCENGHEVIRGLQLSEISLVGNPAYDFARPSAD